MTQTNSLVGLLPGLSSKRVVTASRRNPFAPWSSQNRATSNICFSTCGLR